jgi:hypothetical protein
MIYRGFLCSIVFITSVSFCFSQSKSGITEDSSLTKNIERFRQLNADPEYKIDGWRILVQVSRNRRKVEEDKRKMDKIFPDHRAKMVFEDPYYKLYCCAFRTKLELRRTLTVIREEFPAAFEVASKVSNDDLLRTLKVTNQ